MKQGMSCHRRAFISALRKLHLDITKEKDPPKNHDFVHPLGDYM